MNELRRMAYLQAMGLHNYVSRLQLPGAAPTRRLAIVRDPSTAARRSPGAVPRADKDLHPAELPRIAASAPAAPESLTAAGAAATGSAPRFSLVAIFAGNWLWLEELDEYPLASAQVQLVQAMARALLGTPAHDGEANSEQKPEAAPPMAVPTEVTQFDWPMHNNQQLDLGADAARSSVSAFIRRKLERPGCAGMVLLGQACAGRVPLDQLECERVARTASTAAMLADPSLKKQAWRDLQALYRC